MGRNKIKIGESSHFGIESDCHSFNVSIATFFKCSNTATIINDMIHWRKVNTANQKHFFDGNVWSYMTVKAWNEKYPYITPDKIRGILTKLENLGYIVTGNYNETKYDRTKWYALTEKSANAFNFPFGILPNADSKKPNGIGKTPIRFTENTEPIPNTIQIINTDTNFSHTHENFKEDLEEKKQDTKDSAVPPPPPVELHKRKKYGYDKDEIVNDLKELYKVSETARKQLKEYFEPLGIPKESMNEKYKEFCQKFATHHIKKAKTDFYEKNDVTTDFYFYACLAELHNDFLNAFTWLKKVKSSTKSDKAQTANFAPRANS